MHLAHNLPRAIHPVQLRASLQVLPAAQECIELRGGDGLDRAAQTSDGDPVDACQWASMAPFQFATARWESAA
ncbi:MAG: hypothetical protein WDO73_17315 [Ignavibacteriota bacterium]